MSRGNFSGLEVKMKKTVNKSQNQQSIRPYVLKEGTGWKYRFGIDFTIKVGEVSGSSNAAFMEYVTRKGEEPPSHTHNTEDEIFYVLEGGLTFHCGEESFDVERGGFIFLPHGIAHSYTIPGQGPVRLIVVTSPIKKVGSGGWGGFVLDIESGQGELFEKP
jgi:quercetin dioxygenase-like cupin family protein